ncbi:uncharacterized protein HMPREF1541_00990 [Cyphellophora europaea CBS 101466]|uniref:Putative phospholipase n=1 Tax=Cyphellophora europaea (strain CBS 101466) TaxID=1220924 RepID=W2SDJ2_CYPE1|nr:uncharacterized protein HMPREF1541_00990 [Cyphellophora europaea CBS 101466]ETN46801.1 hypothetical protein HMPREF1541_00990 [Cyphellophora europaea CBS 101466]
MFSLKPSVPILGPYTIGSTEFEIPISEVDTQTSSPDPKVNTIRFRLYYPTDASLNGQSVSWVPSPQKQWTEAFGRFLGASLGWSSVVNPLLSLMAYITIPAVPNAPLQPKSSTYPLVVFSHGLAGNCNTYSSFCGSLASCGIVVAASEHRDGSCPISLVRDATGKVATEINYRKYAHTPTPDVFRGRNTQLRMRLQELDLIYVALTKLNSGEHMSNYASNGTKSTAPTLTGKLDMSPGRVTWAGHSFGACTVTQFVKSVYYRHSLPSLSGTPQENDPDYEPIYTPRSGSALIQQITSSSPVALLDVWTMPFRAPSTQWLWEKPMPCYNVASDVGVPSKGPTTVSVMSSEFYNWTELLNRTIALLSANPAKAAEATQGGQRSPKTPKLEDVQPKTPTFATPPNKHADQEDEMADHQNDLLPPASLALDEAAPGEPIDRSTNASPALSVASLASNSSASTTLPISSGTSPSDSPTSSTTSLSPSITAKPTPAAAPSQTPLTTPLPISPALQSRSSPSTASPARLFHIPHSAHLSQSDFGPLFPTLTRVLMKAVDPNGTMVMNVRAVTQTMRNAGIQGIARVDDAKVREARRKERERETGLWDRFFGGKQTLPEEEEKEEPRDDILEKGQRDKQPGSVAKTEAREEDLPRWVELNLHHVR